MNKKKLKEIKNFLKSRNWENLFNKKTEFHMKFYFRDDGPQCGCAIGLALIAGILPTCYIEKEKGRLAWDYDVDECKVQSYLDISKSQFDFMFNAWWFDIEPSVEEAVNRINIVLKDYVL